ncbi:hypothetical protein DYU11_30970 [Fibrisoma montanum]|uniref:Carboxypeptidase-like regulatory domain-containing protein n=1 Tax=Fibrisoma montanum TaxID=2305895 RepID=A0A418LWH9_9BACT|nr:hypothetical protein DYU11_30970 [Fibrisoma montanum]
MNHKLPLLLTLLMPLITTAQSDSQQTYIISGRVVSALTGNPIPYCQITYKRNSNTRGTDGDSLGNFTLSKLTAGSYNLSFKAIGYSDTDTTITLTDHDITNRNWPVRTTCTALSQDSALIDIRANRIKLFLQSGDPPVRYTSDKRFSKKYRVTFYDFGDLIIHNYDCLVAYNQTVFKYLDQTYGRKWRTSFRPDVPGYK